MPLGHAIVLGGTELRAGFPILSKVAYLDSAAKGAMARSVPDVASAFLAEWNREGAVWERWLDRAWEARSQFAALIGATPASVFVGGSVSGALGSVLSALGYRRRSEILVLHGDFPTLTDSAQGMARLGGHVRVIDQGDHGNVLAVVAQQLTVRTKAVLISHVHHTARHEVDLAELVDLCHRRDVLVLVDAYHSTGVLDVDVRACGVDLLVSGVMKYLLGAPGGLALAYVGDRLLAEADPLVTGWLGSSDPFEDDRDGHDRATGAARFDTGLPSLLCADIARSGLAEVRSWQPVRVEAHVRRLVTACLDGITDTLGTRPPGSLRSAGPLVCLNVADTDAAVRSLARAGVAAGRWRNWVRFSFHGYSDHTDVNALVRALAADRAAFVAAEPFTAA